MKWSWVGAILIVVGVLVLIFPELVILIISNLVGITIVLIGVFYFLRAQR